MKDPLTKKEKDEFFRNVREEFDLQYETLLKRMDGAICPGVPLGKSSHVLARIALTKTAQGFRLYGFKELQRALE